MTIPGTTAAPRATQATRPTMASHATRALRVVGICAAAALTLAGCAAAPQAAAPAREPAATAPGPVATPTPGPTPTPTPTPTPEPLVFPECTALNAVAEQEQAEFFATGLAELVKDRPRETDRAAFTEFTGPSAQLAANAAVQHRACLWVLYITAGITEYAAELPAAPRDAFIAALRDSDYVESTNGPATVFTHRVFKPGAERPFTVSHIFMGEVWLTLIGDGALQYEQASIDAMLAANPGLADSAAA